MANRIIENRRMNDTNIMKNTPRAPDKQEFTWPPETVRTFEEREAVVAALEAFIQINQANLRLQGRDEKKDQALVETAMRVLGRVG